ncbi:hypothetical protein BC936DRAFT_141832, partial [Jimgerdemannia flammicorona]
MCSVWWFRRLSDLRPVRVWMLSSNKAIQEFAGPVRGSDVVEFRRPSDFKAYPVVRTLSSNKLCRNLLVSSSVGFLRPVRGSDVVEQQAVLELAAFVVRRILRPVRGSDVVEQQAVPELAAPLIYCRFRRLSNLRPVCVVRMLSINGLYRNLVVSLSVGFRPVRGSSAPHVYRLYFGFAIALRQDLTSLCQELLASGLPCINLLASKSPRVKTSSSRQDDLLASRPDLLVSRPPRVKTSLHQPPSRVKISSHQDLLLASRPSSSRQDPPPRVKTLLLASRPSS